MSVDIYSSLLKIPQLQPLVDDKGLMTKEWLTFFKAIQENTFNLGIEKTYPILNNQASPVDIVGLSFNSKTESQVSITYLLQRVTTGGGAVELVESGILLACYYPTSDAWNLVSVSEDLPVDAGITFNLTSAGQLQYTSSNITGTASISRISFRASVLRGKNKQYSSVGGGVRT